MALAVVVLGLLGYLVWSRYLHHKEVALLHDQGGDLRAFSEAGERWRIRWGILVGIIMMFAGVALLVPMLIWGARFIALMSSKEDLLTALTIRSVIVGMGAFTAGVGIAVLVAHIIWSRGQRSALADAPAENDKQA